MNFLITMSTNETSPPKANNPATSGAPDPASSRLSVSPPYPELNRILQNIQNGTTDTNGTVDEPSSKNGKYIKLAYKHFD